MNLFHYASPQPFYGLAGRCWPWLAALATVLGMAGLWLGLAVAPTDAQQGEGYRIIFVHVPASWMSMIIYLAMAFWGVLYRSMRMLHVSTVTGIVGLLLTANGYWLFVQW